jgi:hypothetical protein
MTKQIAVKIKARGVHFSEQREEAYFTASFTLPRVGEVEVTYIADKYECHGGDWTAWRILRSYGVPLPVGVGDKTASKMSDAVEPVITAWLASEAYAEAKQKALANYVIRTIKDQRWGLGSGKRAFEQYRSTLTFADQTRIAQAIDHLEAAEELLKHD